MDEGFVSGLETQGEMGESSLLLPPRLFVPVPLATIASLKSPSQEEVITFHNKHC